jgi:hypothetical protein
MELVCAFSRKLPNFVTSQPEAEQDTTWWRSRQKAPARAGFDVPFGTAGCSYSLMACDTDAHVGKHEGNLKNCCQAIQTSRLAL